MGTKLSNLLSCSQLHSRRVPRLITGQKNTCKDFCLKLLGRKKHQSVKLHVTLRTVWDTLGTRMERVLHSYSMRVTQLLPTRAAYTVHQSAGSTPVSVTTRHLRTSTRTWKL